MKRPLFDKQMDEFDKTPNEDETHLGYKEVNNPTINIKLTKEQEDFLRNHGNIEYNHINRTEVMYLPNRFKHELGSLEYAILPNDKKGTVTIDIDLYNELIHNLKVVIDWSSGQMQEKAVRLYMRLQEAKNKF